MNFTDRPDSSRRTPDSAGLRSRSSEHAKSSTLRPGIDGTAKADYVEIELGWQGRRALLPGVHIEVGRGAGIWRFLGIDATPSSTDTEPFPARPAVLQYRAICVVDEQPIGEWSQIPEIIVGGSHTLPAPRLARLARASKLT